MAIEQRELLYLKLQIKIGGFQFDPFPPIFIYTAH